MPVIKPVSEIDIFRTSKLATKFRHKPSNKVFYLRRLTDSKNRPTLFLWNKDDEEQYFDVDIDEWEKVEPPKLDPQLALTTLLEAIHDGERIEILSALDNLVEHIRFMGDLPVIQRDTVGTLEYLQYNAHYVYIVPKEPNNLPIDIVTPDEPTL